MPLSPRQIILLKRAQGARALPATLGQRAEELSSEALDRRVSRAVSTVQPAAVVIEKTITLKHTFRQQRQKTRRMGLSTIPTQAQRGTAL